MYALWFLIFWKESTMYASFFWIRYNNECFEGHVPVKWESDDDWSMITTAEISNTLTRLFIASETPPRDHCKKYLPSICVWAEAKILYRTRVCLVLPNNYKDLDSNIMRVAKRTWPLINQPHIWCARILNDAIVYQRFFPLTITTEKSTTIHPSFRTVTNLHISLKHFSHS